MKNKTLLSTIAIGAALLAAPSAWAGMNSGAQPFAVAGELPQGGVLAKGETFEVQVELRNLDGVRAVHFDMEYDPEGLAFESFEPGGIFDDPLLFGPFDRSDRNVVDITSASKGEPTEAKEADVGRVTFRVLDPEKSNVRIVSFHTSDNDWEVDTQASYDKPIALGKIPPKTTLFGNAPNPFNPTTSIRFALSGRSDVRIDIFDVAGRRIDTLADRPFSAGEHSVTWQGKDASGSDVASGVYFYRFEANGVSEAKRMTLIR